jgi:hypothetical protein
MYNSSITAILEIKYRLLFCVSVLIFALLTDDVVEDISIVLQDFISSNVRVTPVEIIVLY